MEQLDAYLARLEGEEYRDAMKFLVQNCPGATWEITRFPDQRGRLTLPFLKSEAGYFVEVAVTVNGVKRSQMLPVLDEHGEVILDGATSLEIQIALENCFLVCVALHGLDPHRTEKAIVSSEQSEVGQQLSGERQKEFTSHLYSSSDERSAPPAIPVQNEALVSATDAGELPPPPEMSSSVPSDDLYRFIDLEIVVDDEQTGKYHYLMRAMYRGRKVEIHVGPEHDAIFDQPIKEQDLFSIETQFFRHERLGEFLYAKRISKAS